MKAIKMKPWVLLLGGAGLGLLSFSIRFSSSAAPPLPANLIAQTTRSNWYNCLTREVWTPEKQAWCDRLSTLQNADYPIPEFGTVTLTNGFYESVDQRFTVTLVNRQGLIDFGDINGDGVDDAAVLLGVNSGGSGQFSYLVPVVSMGETTQSLVPVFLGDRVQVSSLVIENSEIAVNMVTQGPNDPLCCPTQKVTRIYAIQPTLLQVGGDPAEPMELPKPLPSNGSLAN